MIQLLLIILGLVILIFSVPTIFQRNLIYFPVKTKADRSEFAAKDMKIITLHPTKNLTLESWYKPAKNNNPTILYLHGNSGHIGHRVHFTRFFLEKGYGVFLLEYRGYGGNPGKPSEKGLYQDAKTALHFLINDQNINSNKIILYGESLGSAVATKIASESDVCALILQSPHTKLQDLTKYHYPWLLTIIFDKYDSISRINKIKKPILFLQGKQDLIVPPQFAKKLFNQANEPKKWAEFSYKGHNDLWDEEFANTIFAFMEQYCSKLDL